MEDFMMTQDMLALITEKKNMKKEKNAFPRDSFRDICTEDSS